MKAVTFDAPIWRYAATAAAGALSRGLLLGPHACTRIVTMESPALPGPDWVRVRTRLGGICGSDLDIVGLRTSPSTSPLSSFPFVLGHENVADVVEAGRDAGAARVGTRVVVNPLLCCEARGITPPCAACIAGNHSRCSRFTDGMLAPGMFIGTTRGLGGSWGEEFVAHRSQLVPVPDAMRDEAAVLIEPLACAMHAVRLGAVDSAANMLVIGGGTIGLLTVAALRAAVPGSRVTVAVRHPFQADVAASLGATKTVVDGPGQEEALAVAGGTRLLTPILGPRIGVGGFDTTFVAAGTVRALHEALRFTRAGGTVVLTGNTGRLRRIDFTPVWLKELTIRGTLAYGAHGHASPAHHAFVAAAELAGQPDLDLGRLVTHAYPVARTRQALATARGKAGAQSVKVVLDFRRGATAR